MPNVWLVNTTVTGPTLDEIQRNTTLYGDWLEQWEANRTGQFATGPSNQIGWLRLPDNDTIFDTVADPSAGSNAPHYEFIFGDGFNSEVESEPATGYYLTLATIVVSPTSRQSFLSIIFFSSKLTDSDQVVRST